MRFTFTVERDRDYKPWGMAEEDIRHEAGRILQGIWTPYTLTVRAVGPVDSEQSVTGIVVETISPGSYLSLDDIPDTHLRYTAEYTANEIESGYVEKLTAKRDEINAFIEQMGGA